MIPRYIKWALFFVPALVIGGFETVRHTLLTNILPMEMGNWVTAVIDAVVIAIVSRTLFQQFARTEQALSHERESRAVMEERERLARTLHDQIAQSLFYAGVQIQAVKSRAAAYADPALQSELDDISQSLREMDENVRQAIFNLKQKSVVGALLKIESDLISIRPYPRREFAGRWRLLHHFPPCLRRNRFSCLAFSRRRLRT